MSKTNPNKNQVAKRKRTVISIPQEGNEVYGDDVPMPWREAARQTGIADRTFWGLLERSEIIKQLVGVRVMIRPSAIRAYLKRLEIPAI